MKEVNQRKNNISYIFGKKMKDQAKLLRLARKESNQWRQLKLERFHYDYLINFFRKNYLFVSGLLALVFSQGIIETTLIIISRNRLFGLSQTFVVNYLWAIFASLIILFLLNSFFSIKYERSLLVILANSLRRRIFQAYLNRSLASSSADRQASLIAKISYHLPLVSLGVANSFLGFWRWLVYLLIIIIISWIINFNIFIVGLSFLGVSLILGLSAYFIARFYISQEVTFYSRILKEVDFNASNINFLKTFSQEVPVLNKFDRLVWFDSFFRVKRDILLRLGFKVVFALLIVVAVFYHFFSSSFFSLIGLNYGVNQLFFLFLIIYFSRALSEAVRVGLYLFPARLGLFLTILKPNKSVVIDKDFKIINQPLVFYSHKLKLFEEGHYYRNLRFNFSSGERILFIGHNLSGKTALAKLFTGREAYNHRAIKLIIGNQRLEYPAWQKMCASAYLFDPNFRTSRSLMEVILGKVNETITMDELDQALRVINRYPMITKLVSTDGNYNVSAEAVLSNPVRAFALQALHCLISRYYFVVIDNFWLDLKYSPIIDIISLLDKNLSTSIMVVFAQEKNNYLAYHKQYEINEKISTI